MLVALSVEDIATLSVDLRMFCAPSTATVFILTPSLLLNGCLLASQTKLLATAVQLNSATSLRIETLIARGGIVISVKAAFKTAWHKVHKTIYYTNLEVAYHTINTKSKIKGAACTLAIIIVTEAAHAY